MLFRNLTNHQRWLAISSCFTNSKRSNLGLHLGGCLNQENLINSCSACGWQYSVFSLSILEFYSFQKQLLCGVRGILLGIWLLQDNYIILHFRSSQLLCGVSSRCLGFCLFQENWRFQNSIIFFILEVAPLWCERHTFGYFKTNLYFSYSEAAALRFC